MKIEEIIFIVIIINNNNNNNNNNKGLEKGSYPSPILGAYDVNIQPLCAQDCPCVMKSPILQEVALLNILSEHGGSRGVNLGKYPPSPRCTVPCRWTADASVVECKKSKTVNSEKWQPLISSSFTVAGGEIPQWTEYYASYS
jgi:hypothetical protein